MESPTYFLQLRLPDSFRKCPQRFRVKALAGFYERSIRLLAPHLPDEAIIERFPNIAALSLRCTAEQANLLRKVLEENNLGGLAENRRNVTAVCVEKNGGAFSVNSEPPQFFIRDVTDILETYIKLDYSLHTLIELLEKPRDMKRFVVL